MGIWTILIVSSTKGRSAPIIIDIFVLGIAQFLVATHLTPAAQLVATYCVLLILQAWKRSSKKLLLRSIVFAGLSAVLTALNPYARFLASVAQQDVSAHVNLLLGHKVV